eukprot:1525097-Rhodomonas_salina.1
MRGEERGQGGVHSSVPDDILPPSPSLSPMSSTPAPFLFLPPLCLPPLLALSSLLLRSLLWNAGGLLPTRGHARKQRSAWGAARGGGEVRCSRLQPSLLLRRQPARRAMKERLGHSLSWTSSAQR